jgi:hypothetical protein
LGTVVGFFSAFSALFNGGLITTSAADPFVRRMQEHLQTLPRQRSHIGFQQHGGVLSGLQHVFMGYTIDDCNTNLRTCLNRNFGLGCADDTCVTAELHAMFNGTTTCDHVIREANFAGSLAERTEFIHCVERRLLGERVRAYLFPNFPATSFYTGWQFVPALLKEIDDSIRKGVDYSPFPSPEEEEDMDNTSLNAVLAERAVRVRREIPGNWANVVVRFDALEYKLRSGYITNLMKRAAARSRMPRARFAGDWKQDTWQFAKTIGQSAYDSTMIVYQNVPDAIGQAFASMVEAKNLLSDTPTLLRRWAAFRSDWYDRVFNAPVPKEDQEQTRSARNTSCKELSSHPRDRSTYNASRDVRGRHRRLSGLGRSYPRRVPSTIKPLCLHISRESCSNQYCPFWQQSQANGCLP